MDFEVSKLYTYDGPSHYLDRQALVFNLSLDPEGKRADAYKDEVLKVFPQLAESFPRKVVDLFCMVLVQALKMDIDLFVNRYDISRDGDDYVIAVEYLDQKIAKKVIHLVADWMRSFSDGRPLDFKTEWATLQQEFDKSLFGGPTIYSLIEAGLKRNIPVAYLFEENQFQWGYGRKHVRGRSTTFHVDGIKDTEFTMFKDMVKDFLLQCGFPTPQGRNTYQEEDAIQQAEELGYPVVVKPVAGHKGQGVVTGIQDAAGVSKAFKAIVAAASEQGAAFEGAIVEQQIYGTDHRLLAVGGKFAAALQRVPAYVDGDGRSTIADLIERENATVARIDNARSPLCKIKVNDDLTDYLQLQDKSLETVPGNGERVFLRRVANISAGGVSINVTPNVHPLNVKMVNDIAKFFKVTCLGIDVLASDISKPWTEGNFGIIEINAGPGVFMHLVPAIGEPIDVPGLIMRAHFPKERHERIPIVAGNRLNQKFCNLLYERLKTIRPGIELGTLTEAGVSFNGEFLCKNPKHDKNVRIVLRNPRLDFAVFNHTKDDICDFGLVHQGADVVIIEDPSPTEECIARDLLSDGYLLSVAPDHVRVTKGEKELAVFPIAPGQPREEVLLRSIDPVLPELVAKYD